MRIICIVLFVSIFSLGCSQDRKLSVFEFNRAELPTFEISILDESDSDPQEIPSHIDFLIRNGVKLVIVRNDLLELDTSGIDRRAFIFGEQFDNSKNDHKMRIDLPVRYDVFLGEMELVSAMPIEVNNDKHVAIEISRRLNSQMDSKLSNFREKYIKIYYFEGYHDFIISNPDGLVDYNFGRIVIITNLREEKRYETPYEHLVEIYDDEDYSMYSSVVLANMIYTLVKLDNEEWILNK